MTCACDYGQTGTKFVDDFGDNFVNFPYIFKMLIFISISSTHCFIVLFKQFFLQRNSPQRKLAHAIYRDFLVVKLEENLLKIFDIENF